ncbi:octapeptide-repeat protein T2-like [Haliotis rubra]|uniref:octapeptide-repeat protein T2-like n=1 Tax=Haliotis rubra TaxID=36100 RepID=UPI001EE5F055|nr:octapeptide-repeat protein T2-like [Haliotis rubra]
MDIGEIKEEADKREGRRCMDIGETKEEADKEKGKEKMYGHGETKEEADKEKEKTWTLERSREEADKEKGRRCMDMERSREADKEKGKKMDMERWRRGGRLEEDVWRHWRTKKTEEGRRCTWTLEDQGRGRRHWKKMERYQRRGEDVWTLERDQGEEAEKG